MTVAVLATVFVAGLVLGFAARGSGGDADAEDVAEPVTDVRPEDNDERQRSRRQRTPMYEQVEPSEEQRALIDSILVVHRGRMRDLHDEFNDAYYPRYREVLMEAREAIIGVLTPEQATQYRELLEEHDRRRSEQGRDRGDGDDSPDEGDRR